MNEIPSFNRVLQDSIRKYWELPALSDYEINTFRYKDVARVIEKLHILFQTSGVKPGDKISICGKNCSRWGMAFLATLTYGAVAVPILQDFHPNQICDLVNHSESRLLFIGKREWDRISPEQMPGLEGVFGLTDYETLFSRSEQLTEARNNVNRLFGEKYPNAFCPEHVEYYKGQPDDLAAINYTSGSTGNSKGVMIPFRAFWSNYDFGCKAIGDNIKPGDRVLSMLPMAHMYGMIFEFIFQFCRGVHVNFLTKIASPSVLLKSLSEVKPRLVIMVPLIIEKLLRKAVFPKIDKPFVKFLLKLPFVGNRIREKVASELRKGLGGNFYELIIGGAAISPEVETLLRDIGIAYTVGYGATECAPIITYADYSDTVLGSCGKVVPHMEIKIESTDPANIPGEILTRGLNVMLGYYKNEEATAAALDSEGWYHTGDLGVIDAEGNLFIKGRIKNLLLGANGQNIYPEEIEDKLSTMKFVAECVVIQKEQKLYALIFPDAEQVRIANATPQEVTNTMEKNLKELNTLIPSYAQVCGLKIMDKEFEKTPKKSIKRFLYMNEEV